MACGMERTNQHSRYIDRPPTDAPIELECKDDQQFDEEFSIETPIDPKVDPILKELRTNRCMDRAMSSSSRLTMEAQLNWLVKAINNVVYAATKKMKKSIREGYTEVITKLDCVYDIVLRREPNIMTV